MSTRESSVKPHRLTVPLDAGKVEGFDPKMPLKVVARSQDGRVTAAPVKFSRAGAGEATLSFDGAPGHLSVMVGPEELDDLEMVGLQTLSVEVPARLWQEAALTLAPIRIPSYWWFWWPGRCRTYTVRGRVVCPDGSPVPGAEVCAFDIDGWLFWSSRQQVGCTTTDIDGTFSLTFRWCCGWWPWWWFRRRVWMREPDLLGRVRGLLETIPETVPGPIPPRPTLAPLSKTLAFGGFPTDGPLTPELAVDLEGMRKELLARFPATRDPQLLSLWPWAPWTPWFDCAPDLVFRVTQDCVRPGTVLLDEGWSDTRWNVPVNSEVTLVVGDEACCRPRDCQNPPCEDEECLVVTRICGATIDQVGGNLGAAPSPVGYYRPGGALPGSPTWNGDRPWGGSVTLTRNTGELLNVDVYELEVDDGSGWAPLPAGAELDFNRGWLLFDSATNTWSSGAVAFKWDSTTHPGHTVMRTREDFEANGPWADWYPPGGPTSSRFWTSNVDLLASIDSGSFDDGTYRFRVVGWEVSGGALTNRRVLPLCGSDDENEVVLTFDNRPDVSQEPEVAIVAIRANGVPVEACDVVDANSTGMLEIDFLARDVSGYLGWYALLAEYGDTQSVNLLNRPGAVVTSLGAAVTGWDLAPGLNANGSYGVALSQGATAPHWHGGMYRLTVPMAQAFPIPCCYQIELHAGKRTVVSCNMNYPWRREVWVTLGVGVCPPAEEPDREVPGRELERPGGLVVPTPVRVPGELGSLSAPRIR